MASESAPLPADASDAALPPPGWLRSIARALVAQEDRAEDAVQETYLVALRAPPRPEPGIARWYRTVVRNVLFGERRSQRRREAREKRVARPEAAPNGHDALEVSELQAALRAAIAELEEPYRTTVIQRYYEDVSTEDIAQREGVTASAVRMRLFRAQRKLRSLLEARFGDARALGAVLVVVAGLAGESLAADGASTAGAATPDTATPDIGTGVVAGSGTRAPRAALLTVAALTLGSLLLWWWWPSGSAPAGTGDRAVVAIDDAPGRAPGDSSASSGTAPAAATAAREPAPEAGTRDPGATHAAVTPARVLVDGLALRVVDAVTSAPLSDARVWFGAPGIRDDIAPPTRPVGVSDSTGVLEVERMSLASAYLRVTRAGYVEYRENVRTRLLSDDGYEVALTPVFPCDVLVTLPDRTPAEGAQVQVMDADAGDGGQTIATDASGRARFEWQTFTPWLRVRVAGHALVETPARAPVTHVQLEPGRAGGGRVLDARGVPVAGCGVELRVDGHERAHRTETDADGHFTTVALPLTGSVLVRAQHPDQAPQQRAVELPWEAPVEFRLGAGMLVRGRVHGAGGEPVSDGSVRVLENVDGRVRSVAETRIGSDGDFQVGPVLPGALLLEVTHPDHAVYLEELAPRAAALDVELGIRLAEPTPVGGHVRAADGAGVAGVVLRLSSAEGQIPFAVEATSAADGAFSFAGATLVMPRTPLERGDRIQLEERPLDVPGTGDAASTSTQWLLEVQKPYNVATRNGAPVEQLGIYGSSNSWPVTPGEQDIELRLTPDDGDPLIRFQLRDSAARRIRAPAYLLAISPEGWASSFDTDVFGNPMKLYDSQALAGTVLWVMSPEYGWRSLEVTSVDSLAAVDVPLHARRQEPLRITVVDADGQPAAARHVFAGEVQDGRAPFGGILLGTTDESGRLDSHDLGPGSYRLFVARNTIPWLVDKEPGYIGFKVPGWNTSVELAPDGLVEVSMTVGAIQ